MASKLLLHCTLWRLLNGCLRVRLHKLVAL
jgi:hypothetical protein